MTFNLTSVKTSSNGAWQGDNPLDYAFPLLIIQITLVLVIGRSLSFLLKPLRQPNVIAEIVGGILLGPSALGRNKTYLNRIFPSWSTPILESVASIGLLFFLFLVGLELDLKSIRRSGRKAFAIAAAGISLPFTCGVGVAYVLRATVAGAKEAGYAQFLVFMGVSLSITAFPVLARILAELKLLTTRVGETAMAAAAFNDMVAWVLLALAVALAGNGKGGSHKSPILCVWVLLSGVAFVVFMLVVIRPVMTWVGQRCSPEQEVVDESYIYLTLAGVLVSGFITDLIGIHSIFGAFVFGLTIPKEGEFARNLIERIEDFVSGLLLPLYFASSGLKTDVTKIHGAESWGLLVLVIVTACVGKIFGTFFAAMLSKIPARESLTLGVLMNTKGLVELIVLNIGKEKKVLNDEVFAILVLMALFTTFITTPTVMALYKPARAPALPAQRKLQRDSPSNVKAKTKDKLRILACVHGPGNVPSLISFIESIRGNKKSPLKLYIMHLVELTERTSSIILAQRARRNGLPFIDRLRSEESHDGVTVAFEAYGQLGRVKVRTMTAISALHTMHEDVCQVAEEKRVSMIILPFHRQSRGDGSGSGSGELENVGHSWRMVNQRILKDSPCSVAVLVSRRLGGGSKRITPSSSATVAKGVCVVFFGGPDDREALELGGRMAEHPEVKVTVIRFMEEQGATPTGIMLRPSPEKCSDKNYSFSTAVMDRAREKELDEAAVAEFRRRWEGMAEYTERVAKENIVEGVVTIGSSGEYELFVVGKGRFPSTMVAELADRSAVHPELGPIGDVLASSGHGVLSSVLVIQQHDVKHGNEVPACKIVGGTETSVTATVTPIGTSITTTTVSV
ncbi:cation/H(+) antiporter 20-like [Telopea speciosissima]|uniref:cation/H(+) antiporter 20-like n=1 Tax=Telopea speciosissima TaxID=54955 RepID=UPI001CC3E62E|nr:cation/H(+) antiporter 20-like [Telopea speciosissima]